MPAFRAHTLFGPSASMSYPSILRCLGWRRKWKLDDHTQVYADAQAETASESIEAQTEDVSEIGGTYGGGASAAEGDVWRACCGEGYSGGQEKDWMMHLKEDI